MFIIPLKQTSLLPSFLKGKTSRKESKAINSKQESSLNFVELSRHALDPTVNEGTVEVPEMAEQNMLAPTDMSFRC